MNESGYINLDLDIVSSEDLFPLAEYLDQHACLLSHETVNELNYITVEASLGSEGITPEDSVIQMMSIIESLPDDLYKLFSEAKSRVFDFGFEGGYETDPYRSELGANNIKLTSKHNIGFRFTIYSYREEEDSNA